jgi:hypothetical protein
MKGKIISSVIIFAVLITSAWLTTQVHATSISVGVQTGNYFQYKVGPVDSTSELYGVDNFTVTVTNVIGTMVYANQTYYLNNGTVSSNQGIVDLTNGNCTVGAWILVDANLTLGEPIYPGWPLWGNDTVTINGRTTGHLSVNNTYINLTTGPQGYMTANIYCDQATGAIVNASVTLTGQYPHSFIYSLIATNAWTVIPEFSQLTMLMAMTTLTVSTVAIAYRRKLKLQQ